MTENQKQTRVNCCRDLTQMAQADPDVFERYITGNETWIYYYDPESRQQSMGWCHPNSPRPKKFRAEKSGKEFLAIVVFFLGYSWFDLCRISSKRCNNELRHVYSNTEEVEGKNISC